MLIIRCAGEHPELTRAGGGGSVTNSALRCFTEHASQLMQKAFDVAISTNIGTASYISDAMALLNVQTGA